MPSILKGFAGCKAGPGRKTLLARNCIIRFHAQTHSKLLHCHIPTSACIVKLVLAWTLTNFPSTSRGPALGFAGPSWLNCPRSRKVPTFCSCTTSGQRSRAGIQVRRGGRLRPIKLVSCSLLTPTLRHCIPTICAGATIGEIGKEVGEIWKSLGEEDKKVREKDWGWASLHLEK